MTRRKAHTPLHVWLNSRRVGRFEKEAGGAVGFEYDPAWLSQAGSMAISRALPLSDRTYRGEAVMAVFENLLPDNDRVRQQVAERTGADGTDAYSLLARIGRDCVGALQFLPDDVEPQTRAAVRGEPVDDAEIERMLANLDNAPLGMDDAHELRISIAGAQEKTALLRHDGQWMRPLGTTPTTHIFKPQIGTIPTSSGLIDLSDSVDNEHYCLKLLEAFGLQVAQTRIATFGARRVLVVERFDRVRLGDGRLIRLPQEDCCQALGVPPSRKYQSTVIGGQNGPGAVDILRLLQEGDSPADDQAAFLKSQILFWLIGATDGHAKNFSIALRPGGFRLTPFYDVLSAQLAVDRRQIPHNRFKLAMSAGNNRHYAIGNVRGRHFRETAKAAGLGPSIVNRVIEEIRDAASTAPDIALAAMPADFATSIHESLSRAIAERSPRLGNDA